MLFLLYIPVGTAAGDMDERKGCSALDRKLTQLLQPSAQLYFICLILFTLGTCFFSPYLAAGEAVVVILLGLYDHRSRRTRQKAIQKYLDNVTGNVEQATKDSVTNAPLPMLIFRPESGDIIWSNDRFLSIAGEREHL